MKHATLFVVLLSGFLFTLLFHSHVPGINLIIFEFIVVGFLFARNEVNLKNKSILLLFCLQVITGFSTVVIFSVFAYLVHIIITITFVGVALYPSAKSTCTSFIIALQHTVVAQWIFLKQLAELKVGNNSPGLFLWKSRVFVIPLLVIIIFISLYNFSNPVFNHLSANIFSGITNYLLHFMEMINLPLLFTMALGLVISNFCLQRNIYAFDVRKDLNASDFIGTARLKFIGVFNKLKIINEIKSATFLLSALNIIILILNAIEIKWVWFGFAWEGQYLKQFVHAGTNLLILSILISIAIVLYFFRGGINYLKNPTVKYLSYLWLFQNGILVISVFIRNYYYIQHFNLAYKRIGVILFLALTLYGLFTVYMKVKNRHSTFYLFRKNFTAALILLTLGTFLMWDPMIAHYNFANRERAFIHFNYLASLSNKSLSEMDLSLDELRQIHQNQSRKFPQESNYLTPEAFHETIQKRKERFKTRWENKSWLEWNYPEHLAYQKLFHPGKEKK